jgi:Pyruvate/2-oxoacid:ferredoxin oxidoreductase gamma subunit
VEREVILTGIGGQGVQLAAQVLARAAVHEARQVMLLGTYGGSMRGGNTDSTLVVADAPIATPPIVSRTWSALAMHHQFWLPLRAKLRPGAVVVLNATLFEGEVDRTRYRVFEVPATRLASELGSPLAASLVLIGAFARLTGIVGPAALELGLGESLPPYRRQHLERNQAALRAGYEAAPADAAPAWREEAA